MEVSNVVDTRRSDGWIQFVAHNRFVEAKVFNEGSHYGINDGRVSKLVIAKDGITKLGLGSGLSFHESLEYSYDRGEDMNTIPANVLNDIVEYLEALPEVW